MPLDKNMTILVVDDFSTMRRIITNVLRQLGFENLFEAEDGSKALKVLEAERVDFVITDWNMPQMSGLDLLKAIRASDKEELKGIPVLMVTAEALQDNIMAAAKAGVNNYIIKPFDAQTLAAAGYSICAHPGLVRYTVVHAVKEPNFFSTSQRRTSPRTGRWN